MFNIILIDVRKYWFSKRGAFMAMVILLIISFFFQGIHDFVNDVNEKINGVGVYAFLMSDSYSHNLVLMNFIIFISNAPFGDVNQIYVILRSGRKRWNAAQITYLFFAALVYHLLVVLLCNAMLTGDVELEKYWGSAEHTLAQTSAKYIFNIPLSFPYKIIYLYTPWQALGLSLTLNIAVSFILGLIIYVVNILWKAGAGAFFAIVFCVFDLAFNGLGLANKFYQYSLVSMSSLAVIDPGFNRFIPTLYVTFIRYTIILLFLLFLSFYCYRNLKVDTFEGGVI